MSWAESTRRQHRRCGLRDASDLTEEEWPSIAPHLPPAKRLGRPRDTEPRAVLNAMLCLLTTGCRWRLRPKEFPPCTSVPRFVYGWRDDGRWRRINHHRLLAAREAMRREASPSAGVIDRQSVKTTGSGGPRGDGAAKTIPIGSSRRAGSAARTGSPALPSMGRNRHILTDSHGWLVAATVHTADIQDRDGAVPLLGSIRTAFPLRWRLAASEPLRGPDRRRWRRWLRHVVADGVYAGPKLRTALAAHGRRTLEIVKRSDVAKGFELLPRRRVVERTLAWLNRNRRLATDFATPIETATAWPRLGSVKLLSRRLARG